MDNSTLSRRLIPPPAKLDICASGTLSDSQLSRAVSSVVGAVVKLAESQSSELLRVIHIGEKVSIARYTTVDTLKATLTLA
ncbi:hypothetical protein KIN20_010794 [Parelaphostrongylus tenuis]|uniref:Uncharacterized protein n=1 Tax=Parelaphostrongylus tenuis TaxID=148309 RepID=A0AAD5QJ24_PARTN|nr:hypothetical protein KIN20_010794 [Parelaphostrongylus tenuis]